MEAFLGRPEKEWDLTMNKKSRKLFGNYYHMCNAGLLEELVLCCGVHYRDYTKASLPALLIIIAMNLGRSRWYNWRDGAQFCQLLDSPLACINFADWKKRIEAIGSAYKLFDDDQSCHRVLRFFEIYLFMRDVTSPVIEIDRWNMEDIIPYRPPDLRRTVDHQSDICDRFADYRKAITSTYRNTAHSITRFISVEMRESGTFNISLFYPGGVVPSGRITVEDNSDEDSE